MPRGRRDFLISAVHFDAELGSGAVSVLDLAPLAVKHGARGVEYRDVYWRDKGKELPAVREQAATLGLEVTYTTVTTLYNGDRAGQKRLLRDIEDAKELGSSLLRVQLGVHPAAGPDGTPVREAAKNAIGHAARLGVKLAVENNSRAPGEKLANVRATLEEFDSPALGTNVDFANYAANDQDPVAAIKALAPWIIYVHGKDARKTDGDWTSTYLGAGTLPLKDVMAALDATGRSVPFCFEFPGGGDPEGAIIKSKAFLESML